MTRVTLYAFTLVALLANIACGAEKLSWKIADGSKSTTTMTNKVNQILTIAGMDVETGQDQTIVVEGVAGQRGPDGKIDVTSTVTTLKSKITLPGGVEIDFDSANPPAPQGTQFDVLIDVFKAISGMKTTNTYGKDNRVDSVRFDKEILADLGDDVKALVEDQLDADYLKDMENGQRAAVSDKEVAVGDTWNNSTTVRLGAGQTFTFDTTYKYAGAMERDGKKLHVIESKSTKVEYDVENPSAPFQVKDSELKIDSSEGRILFDNQLGRIVESTENVRITGDLTIEVNGMEFESTLDLTIESETAIK